MVKGFRLIASPRKKMWSDQYGFKNDRSVGSTEALQVTPYMCHIVCNKFFFNLYINISCKSTDIWCNLKVAQYKIATLNLMEFQGGGMQALP